MTAGVRQGARRLLPHDLAPGLTLLRGYTRAWLPGDVAAGVTVAAYMVPQVMAYAGLARLPPAAGLWAAIPALAIYAVFGSSRFLSMGPEATTALMTAIAIGPLARGDPARYATLAVLLALLTATFAVAAWLLRLGFVADLLSRPVVVGYLTGLGLIMIASQLAEATGVHVTGIDFVPRMTSFWSNVSELRWPTTVLTAAVLGFLIVARLGWPGLPGPLLAVLLATVVVWGAGLSAHGIAIVGPVPARPPGFGPPAISAADVRTLLLPAAAVLVVAFSDDVLTARSFARTRDVIDPGAELLALGLSNAAAASVHAWPVSSSATRSAIGVATGARSQVSSLVTAAAVAIVLAVARPVLARFPEAALAAIVIFAGGRLIDLQALRRLAEFRRRELLLALAACAGVLVFNILYGVLAAVGLSVAELLTRVGRPHDAVLGRVPGLAGMHDVDDYPRARTIPGLVVYRYDAPLFFANAEDFRRRALGAVDCQPRPVLEFLLNVEANVEVDFTALEAVEAVRAELERRGIVFALARVKQDLLVQLTAFGLTAKVGAARIFPTLPTAVEAYEKEFGDRLAAE